MYRALAVRLMPKKSEASKLPADMIRVLRAGGDMVYKVNDPNPKAGHGRPAATSRPRYAIAAFLNGAVVTLFVALAARRLQPRQRILTGAKLLSLSRAWGAGLLAGTAATPPLGRGTAWLALLWGGPSDWLDGRLARRDGATALGAIPRH